VGRSTWNLWGRKVLKKAAARVARRVFNTPRFGISPEIQRVFGHRAAGAALLSKLSIERGALVLGDPDTMKVT
jgi:hypothetical protein